MSKLVPQYISNFTRPPLLMMEIKFDTPFQQLCSKFIDRKRKRNKGNPKIADRKRSNVSWSLLTLFYVLRQVLTNDQKR